MGKTHDHLDKFRQAAKRLILDPDGRKALKEFGIEVELSGQESIEDKPIVAVLCPTYRAPDPLMQDSLGAMVKHTRESGMATVYGGSPIQSSVVHWSRNGLIAAQLNSGKPWTHILFIDDDIVVKPDALLKLISHKKDIVAGLCTRRQDPPQPNIRTFDDKTGRFDQIWEWPENQLVEVGGVGTGLMLLTKHALEQVGQAYFDCLWEKEFYGLEGEKLDRLKSLRLKTFDASRLAYWFRFLPAFDKAIEYGEDMSFCMVAKRYCGLQVFVDTSVQPGHIGSYPFSIRDFLPYREQCKKAANENGRQIDFNKVEVSKPDYSIVIPSGNPHNLLACLQSIMENEPGLFGEKIIVVEDYPDAIVFPIPGVRKIRGQKPFNFARNSNMGIREANSDVILLNDDCRLLTHGGFSKIAGMKLRAIVSASIDGFVGNRNQNSMNKGTRPESRMLCFMAVFIPKEIQNKVGLLDERFTAYGYEDDDYCKRALQLGFPLFIEDRCVVEHGKLESVWRRDPGWESLMAQNQQIYREKWA